MKLVSVIIPYFNAEKTIETAIKSVYNQSDINVEIICVDDGSFDSSRNLVESISRKIPLKNIALEENFGASYARNRGLIESSGDLVQFLDADDYLYERKICSQAKLLLESKSSFVAGAYIFSKPGMFEKTIKPDFNCWSGLIKSRLGRTSSNLFTKKSLIGIKGFNTTLASSQEYDLMFRLLKEDNTCSVDNEPLTKIYSTPGSISNTDPNKNLQRFFNLRSSIIKYLIEKNKLTSDLRNEIYHNLKLTLCSSVDEQRNELWDATVGQYLGGINQ